MGYLSGYEGESKLGYPALPLTNTRIKNAKPSSRPYKIFDERGLFLLVNPSGSKLWRFRYSFAKREKLISFGAYPDVTLANAREKRRAARELLENGTDPSAARRARVAACAESLSWTGTHR